MCTRTQIFTSSGHGTGSNANGRGQTVAHICRTAQVTEDRTNALLNPPRPPTPTHSKVPRPLPLTTCAVPETL